MRTTLQRSAERKWPQFADSFERLARKLSKTSGLDYKKARELAKVQLFRILSGETVSAVVGSSSFCMTRKKKIEELYNEFLSKWHALEKRPEDIRNLIEKFEGNVRGGGFDTSNTFFIRIKN